MPLLMVIAEGPGLILLAAKHPESMISGLRDFVPRTAVPL
jgi:hypothetical protein